MPADPWAEKAMLDWVLGGATPTQPASWFVGLAGGSPTSVSASELTAQLSGGTSRLAVVFGAASTPATSGTASNTAAITFSFVSAATVRGVNVWNASSGGTRLAYGTTAASSVMVAADTYAFPIGSLRITLS